MSIQPVLATTRLGLLINQYDKHGQPIGRLVPLQKSLEARLQELAGADLITWNGNKYLPDPSRARPLLSPDALKTAAEIVLEERA